jgi:hypothetical protein
MTDSQFHQSVLAELKESNRLMKAMVSELSQIKFELVNERLRKDAPKKPLSEYVPKIMFDPVAQTGPSEYHPKVSKEYEPAVDVMK